jgi:hypothetical protein
MAALSMRVALCLSFFIMLPDTIERSGSTFMLGRMQEREPAAHADLRQIVSVAIGVETHAVECRTS